MSNIVKLHRDTVQAVLDEISSDMPDAIVAFAMKDHKFFIHASNLGSVTFVLGALERIKFDLLSDQP